MMVTARMFLATVLLTVAVPSAAATGTSVDRSVTRPYQLPEGVVVAGNGAEFEHPVKTLSFRSRRSERRVSFQVSDESGLSARGHVYVDKDDDGRWEKIGEFCSETDRPIQVAPRQRVAVALLSGTCEAGDPSLITQGELTATFTR
jgi:hypothetical protein